MFGKNVKLDPDILKRAKKVAEVAGYPSTDEFITHIVEKELARIGGDGESLEEVEKRLKGLGYIS